MGRDVPTPTLVVVSGPPTSGKTTLAHALAAAIPCLAVCRDEIKEGMVHAHGGDFHAGPGDPITARTMPVFFEVLRVLVGGGVTVVAESAFQDKLWRHGLEPLSDLVHLRASTAPWTTTSHASGWLACGRHTATARRPR